MKKASVTKWPKGTAKYVVAHARWQHSKGRKPSEPFMHERNPQKALAMALKFTHPAEIVEYTINGKKIKLDINKIYLDFYWGEEGGRLEGMNFEGLLESIRAGKTELDEDMREFMTYLQRWVIDAPRKRALRDMSKRGSIVMTSDALFEESGGEDIIDSLENAGLFAAYFISEIWGEEERPVDTIRKMNPGVHIPTGAQLAAELSKED